MKDIYLVLVPADFEQRPIYKTPESAMEAARRTASDCQKALVVQVVGAYSVPRANEACVSDVFGQIRIDPRGEPSLRDALRDHIKQKDVELARNGLDRQERIDALAPMQAALDALEDAPVHLKFCLDTGRAVPFVARPEWTIAKCIEDVLKLTQASGLVWIAYDWQANDIPPATTVRELGSRAVGTILLVQKVPAPAPPAAPPEIPALESPPIDIPPNHEWRADLLFTAHGEPIALSALPDWTMLECIERVLNGLSEKDPRNPGDWIARDAKGNPVRYMATVTEFRDAGPFVLTLPTGHGG